MSQPRRTTLSTITFDLVRAPGNIGPPKHSNTVDHRTTQAKAVDGNNATVAVFRQNEKVLEFLQEQVEPVRSGPMSGASATSTSKKKTRTLAQKQACRAKDDVRAHEKERARIDKFYTGVKVPEAAKEAILKSWEQERQVTMIPFVAKA